MGISTNSFSKFDSELKAKGTLQSGLSAAIPFFPMDPGQQNHEDFQGPWTLLLYFGNSSPTSLFRKMKIWRNVVFLTLGIKSNTKKTDYFPNQNVVMTETVAPSLKLFIRYYNCYCSYPKRWQLCPSIALSLKINFGFVLLSQTKMVLKNILEVYRTRKTYILHSILNAFKDIFYTILLFTSAVSAVCLLCMYARICKILILFKLHSSVRKKNMFFWDLPEINKKSLRCQSTFPFPPVYLYKILRHTEI